MKNAFLQTKIKSLVFRVMFLATVFFLTIPQYAYAGQATEALPQKILRLVVGWGSAIGLIILAISLVVDIANHVKGNTSIFKIVGKVVFVLILLGIMVATLSYDPEKFSGIVTETIDHLPSSWD